MRLLTSQKDTLFDLIQAYGLSPAQFEFSTERDTPYGPVKTYLRYKNSDYYFKFDSLHDEHYCEYCPGDGSYTQDYHAGDWTSEVFYFRCWIDNLLRELNAPNKWDRFQKEVESINVSYSNDQDKFTVKEFEELKVKMSSLKEGVKTLELSPAQIDAVNNKLDSLIESAKEMNKFDWKSLFIGTIISIIIQLSVTQENANALWILIKQVFNNYFLS